MKRKLLSDVELRAQWARNRKKIYHLEEGAILTPAARDFIRENGIELCYEAPPEKMSRTSIPNQAGDRRYTNLVTGEALTEKPEEMTHLRGNLLVSKCHPRIAFRGKLDSLMAQMMNVQLIAAEEDNTRLVAELEELMTYIHGILAAEVKDSPLGKPSLLGLDSAGIRRVSHDVKTEIGIDHPVPNYRMGKLCVALNLLRTQVRETELSAVAAFQDGGICSRRDIVESLNRLSSCVYILFCRKLAGYYESVG